MKFKGIGGLENICKYFNFDCEIVKKKLGIGLSFSEIEKELKQEKIKNKRKEYFHNYYEKVLKNKRKRFFSKMYR